MVWASQEPPRVGRVDDLLQRDRTLDHPELEFCALMQRDRTLDHPELEFCALCSETELWTTQN